MSPFVCYGLLCKQPRIYVFVLAFISILPFVRLTQKLHHKNCDGSSVTPPDKGSAEPLSRDMQGSHSSLDDKNPDVIPQEPTSDDEFLSEEKAFERLNSEKYIYGQALNLSTATTTIMDAPSPTHATLQSILNSATLNRQHSLQNKSKVSGMLRPTGLGSGCKSGFCSDALTSAALISHSACQYGELSLTTNPSFALYNSPMHSVSPGSNIYTRIPTRPSTALGGPYFGNDHQLKLSPTCAESSLIVPTTSSPSAYVYTSYNNGGGATPGSGLGMPGGLSLNQSTPDCNGLASNYVLYGTTGKKQPSPSRVTGAGARGAGATTATTPLISTANYNGFGKPGLITATTTGNYDEFIS